jgi:transposase-like protein
MPKPPQPLTALSEAQRTQANARFATIRLTLQEGITQAQVAPNHDLPRSQVQRWIKNDPEKSLAELANAARSDKGQSHNLPDQTVELIEGLATSFHARLSPFIAKLSKSPQTKGGDCPTMLVFIRSSRPPPLCVDQVRMRCLKNLRFLRERDEL